MNQFKEEVERLNNENRLLNASLVTRAQEEVNRLVVVVRSRDSLQRQIPHLNEEVERLTNANIQLEKLLMTKKEWIRKQDGEIWRISNLLRKAESENSMMQAQKNLMSIQDAQIDFLKHMYTLKAAEVQRISR